MFYQYNLFLAHPNEEICAEKNWRSFKTRCTLLQVNCQDDSYLIQWNSGYQLVAQASKMALESPLVLLLIGLSFENSLTKFSSDLLSTHNDNWVPVLVKHLHTECLSIIIMHRKSKYCRALIEMYGALCIYLRENRTCVF